MARKEITRLDKARVTRLWTLVVNKPAGRVVKFQILIILILKVDPDYVQKVDPDCVTLLEGINKLNKLILAKSKLFTLAFYSPTFWL